MFYYTIANMALASYFIVMIKYLNCHELHNQIGIMLFWQLFRNERKKSKTWNLKTVIFWWRQLFVSDETIEDK